MKKSIVLTTIFPPRKDVKAFAQVKDWQMIAVGDLKTPKNWHVDNVRYLSPKDQNTLFHKFSSLLPWNSYARKNMGYLLAIKENFQLLAETDDDVSPYDNYPPPLATKKNVTVLSGPKFLNIYKYFNKGDSWPRGFPLDCITQNVTVTEKKKNVRALIYNSVIDQDSDFDAIYRLTSNKPVSFKKTGEYALAKGVYCPFNTQNTFFFKDAFPLLYIPSYVDERVTDIWKGYIAQRILWEIGGNLIFTHTTTYTNDRNPHDYLKDFEKELPLYLDTKRLITILDSLSLSKDISKSLLKTYEVLVKEEFFGKDEIALVKSWLKEIEKYL